MDDDTPRIPSSLKGKNKASDALSDEGESEIEEDEPAWKTTSLGKSTV